LIAGLVLLGPAAVFAKDARIDGLVAARDEAGAGGATEGTTVTDIARAVAVPADVLRGQQARSAPGWEALSRWDCAIG
jgi:hypothetical protein